MQLPDTPAVLVLLVATDAESWLPDVLRGLRAQKHPSMMVLAVDNASTDDTPRILKKAFGARVLTLEHRVGYGRALAAALKVAAERELEADAVLVLHDDAALAPGAIAAMVEALRIDEVGIVGPKLLEWDEPGILQDIGRTTDRYGRIVSRVDRDEIDQGQHDGLHEVLYATSSALLIAREVIERVGLFDLRYEALREDLDLCWRARIAGYRTVVTTDAVARHAAATVRDGRPGPVRRRVRYFGDRNLIATLIKNYSWSRLTLALPVTLLVSILNVVLYAIRGRRASAVQVLEALRWNALQFPATLRARRKVQGARTVGDREITRLMHGGASRVRDQIERAVESMIGEVEEVTEEDLEAPPKRVIDRLRAHPGGVALVVVFVIAILGARPLLVSGSVAGADMPPFPSGATALFQEYATGWRGPMAGGAGPATPGFVLLGLLTILTFGSGWLAQRVLLFGLPVLGAIGMVRLARGLGLGPAGVRIAAVAYGASPLMLGAFGAGRLSDLVLTAAAPFLLLPLLRAVGVLPARGWRSLAAGVLGLAATAALAPWALVFVAGAGVVLAITRHAARVAVLRATGAMAGGAFVLLLPWSIELLRSGSPLGAGGADASPTIVDLLGLSPGIASPVPAVLALGIAAAGAVGIVIAPRERRSILLPLAIVGGVALAAAWAVARGLPWIAPRASLPLIGFGVAIAVLAAQGVQTAARELSARTFGAQHMAVSLVGLLLAVQVAGTAGWVAFGDRPGLVPADTFGLTQLAQEARELGTFRIAWIGGSADAPTVSLSGPEGATMRGFLARRAGHAQEVVRRIVASMMERSTDASGRLLATLGVRYVIVRPEADAAVRQAVAAQPDLSFVQRLRTAQTIETSETPEEGAREGALLYSNEAGLEIATPMRSPGWTAASAGEISQVLTAEPRPRTGEGLVEEPPGTFSGPIAGEDTVLLLAEDFSPAWRLLVGTRLVEPEPSFGWATRFVVSAEGPATVWFAGQRWHRAGILLQALLVAGFLIWRQQRIAAERGES